jgi:hypothetical protein
VGRRQPQHLPGKLLPSARHVRQARRAAGIDDRSRLVDAPVGQGDPAWLHLRDDRAGDQPARGQDLAQARVQPLAGDAVVGGAQVPASFGKAHVVAKPAGRDQRFEQFVARRDVTGKKGPHVIAAAAFALLEHADAHVRTPRGEGEGDQPSGKAAAQDRDIG